MTPSPSEKHSNPLYEYTPVDKIHLDFTLEHPLTPNFRQNKAWNREDMGGPPEIKAVFTFDDPSLLDECPFVCKISPDKFGEAKYFGCAYGRVSDLEDLQIWVNRFKNPRMLAFDGSPLEN